MHFVFFLQLFPLHPGRWCFTDSNLRLRAWAQFGRSNKHEAFFHTVVRLHAVVASLEHSSPHRRSTLSLRPDHCRVLVERPRWGRGRLGFRSGHVTRSGTIRCWRGRGVLATGSEDDPRAVSSCLAVTRGTFSSRRSGRVGTFLVTPKHPKR